ncbi:TPA: Ig-like domain-containing protein, partial [Enterobacter kobei]|nr:Ig-like domain-containing protein [Enterobacter kobei]
DAKISVIRPSRNTAPANGTTQISVFALVTDSAGNPVSGAEVNWVTDLGVLSETITTTEENGYARIHLRSDKSGLAQITASLNSSSVKAVKVGFVDYIGMLGRNKNSIMADGIDKMEFRLEVKDAYGRPLAGAEVRWETSLGDMEIINDTTDSRGRARMNLTTTETGSGRAQVRALFNGRPVYAEILVYPAPTP